MFPTYSIKINFHQYSSYLKFLWHSGNAHGLHSPFVFELYTKAIKKKTSKDTFKAIEEQRKLFLKDQSWIEIKDLGAGSKKLKHKERRVSDIAGTSLSPAFKCELLYRIIEFLEAKTILEFGTNLGISTRYISLANCVDKCISIEGDEYLYNLAGAHQNEKVDLLNTDFDTGIKKLKQAQKSFDVIFLDGDHKKESTIRYCNDLKALLKNDGLIILDDIYWSKGMTEAWNELKKDEFFGIGIDLFHFGMLFKRHKQPKQEFILRV